MCQKHHGAAFATYASLPREALLIVAGEDMLTAYRSSEGVLRRFCRRCGSPISWHSDTRHPNWISVPMAALDTPWVPAQIRVLHTSSRACWLSG